MGTLHGPVLGALFYVFLKEYLAIRWVELHCCGSRPSLLRTGMTLAGPQAMKQEARADYQRHQ